MVMLYGEGCSGTEVADDWPGETTVHTQKQSGRKRQADSDKVFLVTVHETFGRTGSVS